MYVISSNIDLFDRLYIWSLSMLLAIMMYVSQSIQMLLQLSYVRIIIQLYNTYIIHDTGIYISNSTVIRVDP